MDERALPADGDVLVTRESRSRVIFTVRQLPGVVQFMTSSRDEAVRLAKGFAMKNAVDVWYCEDGAVRLLDAYRRNEDQVR